MKVTVVYDFSVEIEDCSKDKVYMVMSSREFEVLRNALIEAENYEYLEDYETYHQLHEDMINHKSYSKNSKKKALQ